MSDRGPFEAWQVDEGPSRGFAERVVAEVEPVPTCRAGRPRGGKCRFCVSRGCLPRNFFQAVPPRRHRVRSEDCEAEHGVRDVVSSERMSKNRYG